MWPSHAPTCDVVHYDCSCRVSDVTWDEATKTLLPRCVPQLQPDLWCKSGKGMGGYIKKKRMRKKKSRIDENNGNKIIGQKCYGDKKKRLKENQIKTNEK